MKRFFYRTDAGEHGPYDAEDVREAISNGRLPEAIELRAEGTRIWRPASVALKRHPRKVRSEPCASEAAAPSLAEGEPLGLSEAQRDANPYEPPRSIERVPAGDDRHGQRWFAARIVAGMTALPNTPKRPIALTLAVGFTALFGGPLAGLIQLVTEVTKALAERKFLSVALLGFGGLNNVLSLAILWGIWNLRRAAVWLYLPLFLLYLLGFMALSSGTIQSALIVVVLRGSPLAAAYYYARMLR